MELRRERIENGKVKKKRERKSVKGYKTRKLKRLKLRNDFPSRVDFANISLARQSYVRMVAVG